MAIKIKLKKPTIASMARIYPIRGIGQKKTFTKISLFTRLAKGGPIKTGIKKKPTVGGRPKALRRSGSVFGPQGKVKKRVAPIMKRIKK
tara:strand:- start:669 stop:935 length:267 start_codon:yes stop_codon:yes gene_type:complete